MELRPKLAAYFADYATYHTTTGNQWCHVLGIPMIMIALMNLLHTVRLGPIDAALALVASASVWYLTLDYRVGMPFIAVGFASYAGGLLLSTNAAWGLFISGWIVQFVGHGVYEKKSPAFLKNLKHLLIGPLWVFYKLARPLYALILRKSE